MRISSEAIGGYSLRNIVGIALIDILPYEADSKSENMRTLLYKFFTSGVHTDSWNARGRWYTFACWITIDISTYVCASFKKDLYETRAEPR